jgi:dolichol-phosphate mannosyltransferase
MYRGRSVQIILPALNEQGKIGRAVERIPRDIVDHVVVVDDGSTDSTAAEAEAAGAVVLRHEVNRGVGAAIRTGIQHAQAQGIHLCGILAGDDQDDPTELDRFAEAIVDRGYDFVQGSRYLPGGVRLHQPLSRTVMTRAYSVVFSLTTLRWTTDATNGFKLFRTSMCESIPLDQEWLDRYELEPYLLYQAIRRGFKVCEVPVTKFYPPGRVYEDAREPGLVADLTAASPAHTADQALRTPAVPS